jgi:hypothetical protein
MVGAGSRALALGSDALSAVYIKTPIARDLNPRSRSIGTTDRNHHSQFFNKGKGKGITV